MVIALLTHIFVEYIHYHSIAMRTCTRSLRYVLHGCSGSLTRPCAACKLTQTSPPFRSKAANLTESQKQQVASILITQKFEVGEYIVHENDQAASFYIIKSGKVVCKKGQQEMRVLVEGESFGESGLLEGNQIRLMSVVAKEPTIVLSLGKDMLKKLLGDQVELIIYKNIAKWALEKCDGIKELPQSYRDMINSIIELKHLNKGDVYLMKNKPAKENIVIILQGQLNVMPRAHPPSRQTSLF